MTISLQQTFTIMLSSRSNNLSRREAIHLNRKVRSIATSALIHTGTRKKSLNKLQTNNNFSKSLTTMTYLLVMTMKTKEEKVNKEVRQDSIQALMGSNILVKATAATTIITHKFQLHQ